MPQRAQRTRFKPKRYHSSEDSDDCHFSPHNTAAASKRAKHEDADHRTESQHAQREGASSEASGADSVPDSWRPFSKLRQEATFEQKRQLHPATALWRHIAADYAAQLSSLQRVSSSDQTFLLLVQQQQQQQQQLQMPLHVQPVSSRHLHYQHPQQQQQQQQQQESQTELHKEPCSSMRSHNQQQQQHQVENPVQLTKQQQHQVENPVQLTEQQQQQQHMLSSARQSDSIASFPANPAAHAAVFAGSALQSDSAATMAAVGTDAHASQTATAPAQQAAAVAELLTVPSQPAAAVAELPIASSSSPAVANHPSDLTYSQSNTATHAEQLSVLAPTVPCYVPISPFLLVQQDSSSAAHVINSTTGQLTSSGDTLAPLQQPFDQEPVPVQQQLTGVREELVKQHSKDVNDQHVQRQSPIVQGSSVQQNGSALQTAQNVHQYSSDLQPAVEQDDTTHSTRAQPATAQENSAHVQEHRRNSHLATAQDSSANVKQPRSDGLPPTAQDSTLVAVLAAQQGMASSPQANILRACTSSPQQGTTNSLQPESQPHKGSKSCLQGSPEPQTGPASCPQPCPGAQQGFCEKPQAESPSVAQNDSAAQLSRDELWMAHTLASFDSINDGQWSPRELPCTFQVCGSLHNNDRNGIVNDSDIDTLASFDSINEGQWSPRETPCTFQVHGKPTQQ